MQDSDLKDSPFQDSHDRPASDAIAQPDAVMLARAFDLAWDRILQVEGSSADTPDNHRRLAARLVALARAGETDEQVLADAGVIYMCVLAEAVRLGARNRAEFPDPTVDAMGSPGTQAFNPETIEAMSIALDRCLDALPLHAPSSALQFLTNSILEEASRGERDPERLQHHALEALKHR